MGKVDKQPAWFLAGWPVPWELTGVSCWMPFGWETLGPRLPSDVMKAKISPLGFFLIITGACWGGLPVLCLL